MAELPRLMTHSSTPELWKEEEGSEFYHHLCSKGYPLCFVRTVFQEVTWLLRSELPKGSRQKKNEFFETYRACFLTLSNAQEWPMLKERLALSLNELTESAFGDIFPPLVFLAQSSAQRLGSILKR